MEKDIDISDDDFAYNRNISYFNVEILISYLHW